MAKRYYLCPIVETIDGDGLRLFRPKVAEIGVSHTAIIATGPDGVPTTDWCLVMVATDDHAKVRALAGVDPMPDFPLDGKVSAIQRQTLVAMKAAVERRGIDPAVIDGADGYRDAVRAIGRALDSTFDENKFDVLDG